ATPLRRRSATASGPPAGRVHAAPAARGADRVRDPDRRPARLLGAELPGRVEAQRLPPLHAVGERDRAELRPDRPRAERPADDAGPEGGGARAEARELRPAGDAEPHPGAHAPPARAAPRRAPGRAPGPPVPRERARGPRRGLPVDLRPEGE